jgi:hypothetical protein
MQYFGQEKTIQVFDDLGYDFQYTVLSTATPQYPRTSSEVGISVLTEEEYDQ